MSSKLRRMNTLFLEGEYQQVIRSNFWDATNYVDLLECLNPYCGCGDCQLVFFSKEGYDHKTDDGIPIGINVFEKKVYDVEYELSAEQKSKSTELKRLLEEKLKDKDWQLLTIKHKIQKESRIGRTDLASAPYSYEFTKEHLLDETLMISYEEIFPLGELFKVKNEEGNYTIIEQYCKNTKCDCTEMNLHLFEGYDYVKDFSYDYEKDEIEDPKNQWIIDQLKDNYEGFKERVQIRDLNIKNLYTRNRLRIQQEYMESLNKEASQKKEIGRNEKCPCGSGKKYKQCCMNK